MHYLNRAQNAAKCAAFRISISRAYSASSGSSSSNTRTVVYDPNDPESASSICPVRLEQHYYDTIVPDLIMLNYDPNQAHDAYTPLNIEKSVDTIFAEKPPTADGIITNLLTSAHSRTANKRHARRWAKPIYNPIDYTPLNKFQLLDHAPVVREQPLDELLYSMPFIKKLSLTSWTETAIANKSVLYSTIMALSCISGRRASPLFAQKGDASKKIRQGMPLGARVDVVGRDAYFLLDKIKETVLPRLREWEGFAFNVVDGGMLMMILLTTAAVSLKLPDSAVGFFPDIEPHFDMLPRLFETKVTIHTTATSEAEAITLLSGFGLPFAQRSLSKKKASDDDDGGDPWAKFRKKGEKRVVKSKSSGRKK